MNQDKMQLINKIFNQETIRTIWDKEDEKYYISIVDIVTVLTESKNPTTYWRVLKKRLKDMIVLILLSTTILGNTIIYGSLIWHGMLAGMAMTAALIRFGIKGMLFIVVSIFPHQFLLFPAMIMLLVWCGNSCQKQLYLREKKRGQYAHRIISLAGIGVIVFVGCILESYVNPILVSDILKIF